MTGATFNALATGNPIIIETQTNQYADRTSI